MDRQMQSHFTATLSHSFSMPSLAEGSEPISEVEEINEIKSLREMGDQAMQLQDFTVAIKRYNEALEIDDKNMEVLFARTKAFLDMGDNSMALKDAENSINIEPDNPEAYRLYGLTLCQVNNYRDAVSAFLTALDLDPDNADDLTDHIAEVAEHICHIPKDVLEKLEEMDSYKKLSEIGVHLFQAKRYDFCITILEAAQKFQTNQKGITMRILLTLANAHSACKHNEQAISIYQECLSTAIATHEQIYQTKSLVNIATLYLENRDTHQAIVFYEKLLQLEAELEEEAGSQRELPDFWTKELQCGLRLNLSIAYKTIGQMHHAEHHARKYISLLEQFKLEGRIKSESYHNTGMLNEILGNYDEAMKNYNLYLQSSKRNKDRKGMAQAYGCLGSVYAALRNWKLCITYHEQYISMAKRFKDTKMTVMACEMLADTYLMKEDYEKAIEVYDQMLNAAIRTDYRSRATALCKTGNVYREMKRYQHSLFFYEQAYDLADDMEYYDILKICQYNIACIQQHSTQLKDIEQARQYFESLIPFYETKIKEHHDEDTYCPPDYEKQLTECYDGMQCVLSKLGNKNECLQFAEAYRRRYITKMPGYVGSQIGPHLDSVEHITRIVNQQNANVLYYSLLPSRLLIWVLLPGQGVVRFYSGRAEEDEGMIEQVQTLLKEIRGNADWKNLQTTCENRAIPLSEERLNLKRHRNLMLAERKSEDHKENKNNNNENTSNKSPCRKLFNLLIAPVEDILMKLDKGNNLVIIPDKDLFHCPFTILQDWSSNYLSTRHHITILPSILMLEKCVNNELNYLKSQDELDFLRSQVRKGGLNKYLTKTILSNATTPADDAESSLSFMLDLRKVSNPRLVTTQLSLKSELEEKLDHSKENTQLSLEGNRMTSPQSPSQNLPLIPEKSALKAADFLSRVGSPTSLEALLSLHSYSTLTTCTSTGTDITSSSSAVTEFQQISDRERCLAIGNPQLPESAILHGSAWKPSCISLPAAKRELSTVGSWLDVSPITGSQATKETFLKEIQNSTVIHIATFGCWREGYLAFTPNPIRQESGPPQQYSYIVTTSDILACKLNAQLVVLNVGYNSNRTEETIEQGYSLPSAFLAAGAQCVLACSWLTPNIAREKFFYRFYTELQEGCLVTEAMYTGMRFLQSDERYSDIQTWCPFLLIGKNVAINLKQIRHAMLDQKLDQTEKMVEEKSGKEFLNPKTFIPSVPSREENLASVQRILGEILQDHKYHPMVVSDLIDLLDSALKRLHTQDNNRQISLVTDHLLHSKPGLDLLKLLGFHFQAKAEDIMQPYVVYPHWNKDELLIPVYDALRSIMDISEDKDCTQALHDILPAPQEQISLFVDLLAITKHAPEIQLKVSDLSVRPLWQNVKARKVLMNSGFHQIGMILNFNRTPLYRRLMTSVLQFFLAVSAHKSQVLLYRLDVNLLGKPSISKSSQFIEAGKLPSLTPLILPRNQLRMSTPWLSRAERTEEMDEKIKLARSKSDLKEKYHNFVDRAKTWHQITVSAQANEELAKYGRPKSTPNKVKVLPGASASLERVPLKKERLMVIPEVDQRRDYAHFVLQQRLSNIDVRHKNDVMKLYLPYIQST
ncbi:tetratricopeptide repeat protein 28-like isoform X2 [Mytilus edulis]|uniref:tetratricopeptide repeat protein 28-like isoform X2 n=1 Tax=Mytilus edulis TaxID=6550 RepID=UPI0039F07869